MSSWGLFLSPSGGGTAGAAWPFGPGDGLSPENPLHELNAWLGFARACAHSARVQMILATVQADLGRAMAEIAARARGDAEVPTLAAERVSWLAAAREALRTEGPGRLREGPPGDTVSGAILDIAWTVAERVRRDGAGRAEGTGSAIGAYLADLPELIFALARYEEAMADPSP